MIAQVKLYTILFLVAIIYYSASTLKYVSEIISQSFKKKNYKKYTSILSYIHFVSPRPLQNPAHGTHRVGTLWWFLCVWERPRGWGGQDFPLPLLPVCRNREKRESIMQIMSTPFSQKSLPPIGTASGKLRTAQQLYKHGTATLGTHPPNPNAKCKVRALPSACPRAGSTTNLQVWQSLPLPPIRAPGTTRSSLRGRCWWSLSGLVRAL